MAKGAREMMKAKIDQSRAALDKVKQNIVMMGAIYEQDHPEIVEQLKVIFANTQMLDELLEAFRYTY